MKRWQWLLSQIIFPVMLSLAMSNCRSGGWIDPAPLDFARMPGAEDVTEPEQPQAVVEVTGVSEAGAGDTILLEPKSGDFEPDPKNRMKADTNEPSPEQIEEEKKLYPVRYSARRLIREKKYIPLIQKNGILITLQGAAKVNHSATQLLAHTIYVIGENGEIVLIKHPLKIIDRENETVLTAGYGEYRRYGRKAYVKKNPRIEYGSGREKLQMEADVMNHYFQSGVTKAEGNVKIYKQDMVGYGTEAVYERDKDRANLTGNPRIFDKENVYSAKNMYFFRKQEKVLLQKEVKVLITQVEGKNDENDGSKVITTVESDLAEYVTGSRIYLKKKVTFIGTAQRPVHVTREDSETTCLHLVGWGEGLQELEMRDSIEIVYKRDGTRLYGEKAHYWKVPGTVKVESVTTEAGEKKRPYAVFFNKKKKKTGKLSAESMERNLAVNKTYARGDVEVELYSADPGQVTRLHGQWAEMSEEKSEVYLYGDPYIDQGNEKIYAREIVVFPDENRVELIGSLHGNFSGK